MQDKEKEYVRKKLIGRFAKGLNKVKDNALMSNNSNKPLALEEEGKNEEEFKKLDSLNVLQGGAKDLIKQIEESKQQRGSN